MERNLCGGDQNQTGIFQEDARCSRHAKSDGDQYSALCFGESRKEEN